MKRYKNSDLLQVIEILTNQLKEEQRLRMECISEMIRMHDSLPSSISAERIKKILESPGEKFE